MRSVVASHGPGSNPRGNAICNAILLQCFPVLQIFGHQYLDRHCPPSSDVLPLNLAQKLKISKSIKTGPDIAYRPENFTGCPGTGSNQTLEEIRPAVTTSPGTHQSGDRPAAAATDEITRGAKRRAPPPHRIAWPTRNQRPTCAAASVFASASLRPVAPSFLDVVQPMREGAAGGARPVRPRRATSAAEARRRARPRRDAAADLQRARRRARSTETPSLGCTRSTDEFCTNGFSSSNRPELEAAAVQGGGGGVCREEGRRLEPQCKMTALPLNSGKPRDTASRGPTTIVAPGSQFRTCPTDHGKASSNIAP
ncbi:hypothetical protein F511_24500 [Dorcoceras hygrometricum]|uniref:Uncharacterized protein n=1 Tax=Dorcoceras hygrometricum TaxID=472368 RepID=A0A2Z7BPL9_9LAMI|nr:hypothetical protein F511_24500 [Dorcoceras hygrometricum]